jgi:hypothetical protein
MKKPAQEVDPGTSGANESSPGFQPWVIGPAPRPALKVAAEGLAIL